MSIQAAERGRPLSRQCLTLCQNGTKASCDECLLPSLLNLPLDCDSGPSPRCSESGHRPNRRWIGTTHYECIDRCHYTLLSDDLSCEEVVSMKSGYFDNPALLAVLWSISSAHAPMFHIPFLYRAAQVADSCS